MSSIKPIALYLPQFHAIPENDKWWGKGFTEWRKVTQAKPKFAGHYQPHLPSDLGFYDLRLRSVMEEQAELARQYGIYGFCYYHYWFNGERLLEQPIEQMLSSGKPDFPFCLCWANENWTRCWDGFDKEILLKQNYSEEDDRKHIQYLLPFFKDKRYIRIDGKPVFLLYRTELHPNIESAIGIWKDEARKAGLEGLYLIRVENFLRNVDPVDHGCDASMEFAPDLTCAGRKVSHRNKLSHITRKLLHKSGVIKSPYFLNRIYSYPEMAENMLSKAEKPYKYFRCVAPSWDNTARREEGATIYLDSTPEKFQEWTQSVVQKTKENFKDDEQIFFINAWNEWAEGCHLEPDLKFGHAYLQALKKALS
jgi:lipopolysaccharide biosynthesis protein